MIQTANALTEPADIAELMVDQAAYCLPVSQWAVVWADHSKRLTLLAERGLGPAKRRVAHAIAEWIVRSGECFSSANLRRDPRVDQTVSGAAIAFPLLCRGGRVGALIGFDIEAAAEVPALTPTGERLLRELMEPAVASLDAVLRWRRAEALSVTDDLTHLYNSRFLNQSVRREIKRSARSGRPLSLLFIDLDGFKSVNDRHGHLYGSRALVEVAALIQGSARETDVAARFGGDEFALVLPDTGDAGALSVAERVRERIAAHRFLAADGLDVRLTASVGIATLPDAAATADELVAAADSAMYQVKNRGKNGIQAATASGRSGQGQTTRA